MLLARKTTQHVLSLALRAVTFAAIHSYLR